MEHNQLIINAYNTIRSGYRERRRPRNSLIDNSKDIVSKHRYNATDAIHLALERKIKIPPLGLTVSVDQ